MGTWYDIQVWEDKQYRGSVQIQGCRDFNSLKKTALKTIINKAGDRFQAVGIIFENKGIGHRAKVIMRVTL